MTESAPAMSEKKRLNLHERLGLISLIDEGMRLGSTESPLVADLFNDLWDLVNSTAKGSKIDRLKPEGGNKIFRVLEISAETGQTLGRLNTLYLNKPMPCYYLVYVEVTGPFRRQGLGHRIISHFTDFLTEKSAVGLLDNIIPEDDPTYDIYLKHGWQPIHKVIGLDAHENYMVYLPPRLRKRALREPLLRLIHHLKRKRPAIEMRDNEEMVRQTIAEFKELHAALLVYFEADLKEGRSTSLMRFMFTRYVTKLIAFRRRIGELLGYTGGESLEQIALDPAVAALPVQSYAPRGLVSQPSLVCVDNGLASSLPRELLEEPARVIETLPNYRRPSLMTWLAEKNKSPEDTLTIGDLQDLGFDPTRLKEITIDGLVYIFERIQARMIPEIEKKQELLNRLAGEAKGARAYNAKLLTNPPLLAIRNRGNAYVLRRKVPGIHWDEAVEQLQIAPSLKALNDRMKTDLLVTSTVRAALQSAGDILGVPSSELREMMACFVSWDLEANRPGVVADFSGTFLEAVWLA